MRALITKIILTITAWSWIRRLITETRLGRAVAERFVAGETLDQAIEVARRLEGEGFAVSLDHLGEHVTDPVLADTARLAYLECLERIASEGLEANISIKLTQLGMDFDPDRAVKALDDLARRAAELGLTITIDMEESAYTAQTVDMYVDAQRRHGNLGIALQAYLHRTGQDLQRLVQLGGHIRLCKGAYHEPEGVAYQSSGEVDAAYDALATVLMDSPGVKPAIATHDSDRIAHVEALAERRSEPFEYQMLYGVRTRLQNEIVGRGDELRVYVPYGDAWYPYLTRRIAERPGNVWFFLRALFSRG